MPVAEAGEIACHHYATSCMLAPEKHPLNLDGVGKRLSTVEEATEWLQTWRADSEEQCQTLCQKRKVGDNGATSYLRKSRRIERMAVCDDEPTE
jgi:hypothetical protein